MILTRWIKDERIEDELSDFIDIGLRSINNNPIQFVRYNFNSNDANVTLGEWLKAGGYIGSQYIGFFNINAIRTWLTAISVTERIHNFANGINFIMLNFKETYMLDNQRPRIEELKNLELNDSVRREEGKLKYFTPPAYTENDSNIEHSNPEEINIVAFNMAVYGIYCSSPYILLKSDPRRNSSFGNLKNNYTDRNVRLINEVLNRLRIQFPGVKPNLLTYSEFYNLRRRQTQDECFNKLQEFIQKINSNSINFNTFNFIQWSEIFTTIFTFNLGVGEQVFVKENNGIISLNEELKYFIPEDIYKSRLDKLKINIQFYSFESETIEYINDNFSTSLLNIASFLNNPDTRVQTIQILTQVQANSNEYIAEVDEINAAKQAAIDANKATEAAKTIQQRDNERASKNAQKQSNKARDEVIIQRLVRARIPQQESVLGKKLKQANTANTANTAKNSRSRSRNKLKYLKYKAKYLDLLSKLSLN